MSVHYLRIAPGDPLPELTPHAPFRAVVVLAMEYSDEWQNDVSDWLVGSGCLYMMAWGPKCTTWDDSVDWANIAQFPDREIPDEKFVMTTWHDDETLDEVFWFAGFCAHQGWVELRSTIILHVSERDEGEALLARFHAAQNMV